MPQNGRLRLRSRRQLAQIRSDDQRSNQRHRNGPFNPRPLVLDRHDRIPRTRCSPFSRRQRCIVRYSELLCAVVGTHVNSFSADFDFESTCVQLAVAGRTGSRCHDIALLFLKINAGAVSHARREGRCQNL